METKTKNKTKKRKINEIDLENKENNPGVKRNKIEGALGSKKLNQSQEDEQSQVDTIEK